jgi:hypothetical protein
LILFKNSNLNIKPFIVSLSEKRDHILGPLWV